MRSSDSDAWARARGKRSKAMHEGGNVVYLPLEYLGVKERDFFSVEYEGN